MQHFDEQGRRISVIGRDAARNGVVQCVYQCCQDDIPNSARSARSLRQALVFVIARLSKVVQIALAVQACPDPPAQV